MKTLVILSGGLDSTTLLYDSVKWSSHLEAISFFYNQKHKRELELAAKTCEKLGIKHTIIDISFLGEISKSALTTQDHEVPEGHYADENMKQTVVPNRNMIMMSIAAAYALNNDFGQMTIGVHAGDHAIYPDCRAGFIGYMAKAFSMCDWNKLSLRAPYLRMSKGDIIKRGLQLNVDYSLTQTCYKGGEKACGKCGSCVERLEAFAQNNATDPLDYEV